MGLSQSDVLRGLWQLGSRLTISAVSSWERGQVPSIDHVDLLSQVYKAEPQEVLHVMHEMSRERCKAVAAK